MSSESSWSKDAYEIAVRLRSANTILVEGRTDKSLIERFLMEHNFSSNQVIVDTAEMFSGDVFYGLGNREKVRLLLSGLPGVVEDRGRLFILIDREWSDLFDENGALVDWFESVRLGELDFQTLGHSIENYGFDIRFIIYYLRHFGGFVLDETRSQLIGESFAEISVIASSISLALREFNCINRCGGIFELDDFIVDGNLGVSESFYERLNLRGVSQITVDKIQRSVERNRSELGRKPLEHLKFLSHGHLGESIIWCGVASLLRLHGVNSAICRDVAFGRGDEKLRCFHSWLVSIPANDRRPVDELLEMMRSA